MAEHVNDMESEIAEFVDYQLMDGVSEWVLRQRLQDSVNSSISYFWESVEEEWQRVEKHKGSGRRIVHAKSEITRPGILNLRDCQ